MNPVDVSVIVPVYNNESLIARCLESLFSQTLTSIEIIVINDGSTDGTLDEIERLTAGRKNVIVRTTENQGVSQARNEGIALATGEFIGFVDSDDEAAPEMFRTLHTTAAEKGADLTVCDVEKYDAHGVVSNSALNLKPQFLKGEHFRERLIHDLVEFKYYYSCWNKLYRASTIKDHRISFDRRISWGEDLLFNLSCSLHIRSCLVLPSALYRFHEVGNSSAVTFQSHQILKQTALVYDSFLDVLKKTHLEKLRRAFEQPFLKRYFSLINESTFQAILRGRTFAEQYERILTNLSDTGTLQISVLERVDRSDYSLNHRIKLVLLSNQWIRSYAWLAVIYWRFRNPESRGR